MTLASPLPIASRTAPNRVLFGPHVTNLGWGRSLSDRHRAYYQERASGGAGIIVVEEASIHPSDWPYERSPVASECEPGWRSIHRACSPHGSLVLAALGHAGGQGSSAFHQRELWAPSDEPEVNTREVPKVMELSDIREVVEGFRLGAQAANKAGIDGVEINAGQHSLIRQFLSGLTNRRSDDYGSDRLRFAREVLVATREGLGQDMILGLRLSCDEMAPWAGITPEAAEGIAGELVELVDYLVVVRGAIFSVPETRPTLHHPPGFNLDLASRIRRAVNGRVPVFAQGSIVDVDQATWAIDSSSCDGVEMTRAQIAEPRLVQLMVEKTPEQIRPCLLCNQRCQVRDNRNPIVNCVVNPSAGFETLDPVVPTAPALTTAPPLTTAPALPTTPAPPTERPSSHGPPKTHSHVLVVGAGPAGLEAARVSALLGHRVRLIESSPEVGGSARIAAVGTAQARLTDLIKWLEHECLRLGVSIECTSTLSPDEVKDWSGPVILATGSKPAPLGYETTRSAVVVRAAEVLNDLPDSEPGAKLIEPVVIWDPTGGPTGIALAEILATQSRDQDPVQDNNRETGSSKETDPPRETDARSVSYCTSDAIAGNLLALSGDLAGSNVRLQQLGVFIHRRVKPVWVGKNKIRLRHTMTGAETTIPVGTLIDCASPLPNEDLWLETGEQLDRVGDCVAPRTVAEAIREGREAAQRLPAVIQGEAQ